MQRFLPLVFCLVFIVGCGQSYEEALQTLSNEIVVLERMEKKQKETIARYKRRIAKMEELGNESIELRDQQLTEKALKLLEQYHKDHVLALQLTENRINKQTKRVHDAKLVCDKLK